VRRAALLTLVVLVCMGQTGDALRVRAGICTDRPCFQRAQIGFAPANIRVELYVKPHEDNVAAGYGLTCDGALIHESRFDLHGRASGPTFYTTYRDVGPGYCQGTAAIVRKDDEGTITRHAAMSEPVIVR
jgi:hypothetical protein